MRKGNNALLAAGAALLAVSLCLPAVAGETGGTAVIHSEKWDTDIYLVPFEKIDDIEAGDGYLAGYTTDWDDPGYPAVYVSLYDDDFWSDPANEHIAMIRESDAEYYTEGNGFTDVKISPVNTFSANGNEYFWYSLQATDIESGLTTVSYTGAAGMPEGGYLHAEAAGAFDSYTQDTPDAGDAFYESFLGAVYTGEAPENPREAPTEAVTEETGGTEADAETEVETEVETEAEGDGGDHTGTDATANPIYAVLRAVEDLKSFSADMSFYMDGTAILEDAGMELGMTLIMQGNMQTVKDAVTRQYTRTTVSMLGQDQVSESLSYTKKEGDNLTTYKNEGKGWTVEKEADGDGATMLGIFEDAKDNDHIRINETEDAYVFSWDIASTDMAGIPAPMGGDVENSAPFSVIATVDRETFLPVTISLTSQAPVTMAGDGMNMTMETVGMDITFRDYDATQEPEIPAEALDAPIAEEVTE